MCILENDGLAVYISCYSVPEICGPISCQVIEVPKSTYHHLWGLTLADNQTSEEEREMPIDCLLGADNCGQFLEGSVIQGEFPGPVAVLSKFGLSLSGPVNVQGNNHFSINLISVHVLKTESFVVTQDATLKEELTKFRNYETLGIKNEELTLYDSFADQVKFKNGRYEVSLPFKEVHEVIPDNFSHCVQRLKAKLKQLRNSPEILTQYHAAMKDQLKSGVIEPVDTEQAVEPGTVHYLPHREVVRMDRKTTKLRVVFNASSKYPG